MKTLLSRSSGLRRIIRRAWFYCLLTAIALHAGKAPAEQSGDAPCAERLRMFVLEIDKLFARREQVHEAYYEVIRNYLPEKGCNADEVISISKTSKFAMPMLERYAWYDFEFRNSDIHVVFVLRKDTGRIETPAVLWNKVFP